MQPFKHVRVGSIYMEVFAMFGGDNQQAALPLGQGIPGDAFQSIDGDQQCLRIQRFDQLHRLLHDDLGQPGDTRMSDGPLIGLDACFRQQQHIDRARIFGIDQLLPKLGLLEQFRQAGENFHMCLLQLSPDHEQHHQLDALAARNTVIDPRPAATQDDAKIPFPVDKGVGKCKITGNKRLGSGFTLFDRFKHRFGGDPFVFPIGGLDERSDGGRTLFDSQLHDPNRTDQITKIQRPISTRFPDDLMITRRKREHVL